MFLVYLVFGLVGIVFGVIAIKCRQFSKIIFVMFGIVGILGVFCLIQGAKITIFGDEYWMLVTDYRVQEKQVWDDDLKRYVTAQTPWISGYYFDGIVYKSVYINSLVPVKVGKYTPIIVYKEEVSMLPWFHPAHPKGVPNDIHEKLIKYLK